ncbi:hypothetical protein HPP92_008326 [Vanilla planifolia]|uniref:At4g14310 8-bladed propeller domain-containing protein n=1 Tax=Vanilla planifolia TaxID=51239 RepID=A0A835RDG4_VANPL|nr:hypothetical protein HPP92_008326 [Vanilla planifolia]
MSSRLKERGGAGGKVIASNPSRDIFGGSQKEKSNSHSRAVSACRASVTRLSQTAPSAPGKENPRPISAGRTSIYRASSAVVGKENPRSIFSARAIACRPENPSVKKDEKPVSSAGSAVRRSTSSLPRGKFTDCRTDRLPRVANSGEVRNNAGFRSSDKEILGKGQLTRSSSGGTEKSVALVRENFRERKSNGLSGTKSVRVASRVSDIKAKAGGCQAPDVEACLFDSEQRNKTIFSGNNVKPLGDSRTHNFQVPEKLDDAILTEVKQIERNGVGKVAASKTSVSFHSTRFLTINVKEFDGSKDKGTSDLAVKSSIEIDNAANHMVKDSENLHTSENMPQNIFKERHNPCKTTFLDMHHEAEATQLAPKPVGAVGNLCEAVEEVCPSTASIKYQSKIHEKLALLEGKVQKIALEIKHTKDMLDKSKPNESRLVLSDIQKKICGIEKAVGNMKDSAISELASNAVKVSSLQKGHLSSNDSGRVGNSLTSVNSFKNGELEGRFFPHHKLISGFESSLSSGEHDCSTKSMFPKQDEDGKVDVNFIDESLMFSINDGQPKPRRSDVFVQMNQGVLSKMQLGSTSVECSSRDRNEMQQEEVALESNEKLEECDTLENNLPLMACLGIEESSKDHLFEIGKKISTGGWFVSDGEAVLLAHGDNSCSFYDITNSEVKSEYTPKAGLPSNLWGDCWLIRAPGADGCSGRYVVAASAGNATESGFCSWDFYTKDIKAFYVVGEKQNSLSGSSFRSEINPSTRSFLQTSSLLESQSCWYKPCGPLLISATIGQKVISAYDIRDGDLVMTWEVSSQVTEMEYSSPIQWRSRGKVVIAEKEAITLWDVNSLSPQPLQSVPCVGKRIYSLHVNNTDAEIGAGVRQRASSAEAEGNDGSFCTQDSVNVLDHRIPSGVGLRISRHGNCALSIFSRGDSIFVGGTEGSLPAKGTPRSQVEHFSLRKGRIVTTYVMPEFNSHYHHSSITQVWGNNNLAMAICGMGLFVFDAFKEDGHQLSGIFKETRPWRRKRLVQMIYIVRRLTTSNHEHL